MAGLFLCDPIVRIAYEAGLMEVRDMAAPSTPVAGTPFFDLDRS